MNTQPNACACTDCIGAACTCGCQSKTQAAAACACGCQQGKPCECSVRDLAPRTPSVPVGF
ncbi:hypothetical protein [Noviluteimonas dokdonensis]|uniref:hypothetical protein n=1 Tax=Noviluteimonas dokdonensis TaxID=414050 RepID=UPI00056705D4|nr:hypothetical protein [Lysobacter dokdonensis]